MRTAFPDLHFTIDDISTDESKVTMHWTATGTHTARMMGRPPSGGRLSWRGMGTMRMAKGKIVESWGITDMIGVLWRDEISARDALSPAAPEGKIGNGG